MRTIVNKKTRTFRFLLRQKSQLLTFNDPNPSCILRFSGFHSDEWFEATHSSLSFGEALRTFEPRQHLSTQTSPSNVYQFFELFQQYTFRCLFVFDQFRIEKNLYHLDHRSDVKENRRQHIEYSLLLFSTWYPPHFLTILLTHGLSGACWLTHCWLTLTVACQSTPCLLTPSSQHRNMAFRALRKSSVRG